MSYLSPSQIRNLLDSLIAEYETLLENRNKLEVDCNKLKEYIEVQITQINALNNDFIKLKDENVGTVNYNQGRGNQLPQQMDQQADDQGEQDWEVQPMIPVESIKDPIHVSLVAEIVDVSIICSTAFSPDNSCLAIGSNKTLRVYHIINDNFVFQHTIADSSDGQNNHIRSLAWSPDNRYVICGGEDHYMRVFDIMNNTLAASILVGKGEVSGVQCDKGGKFYATVNGDGAVSFWAYDSNQLLWTGIREDAKDTLATCICFSDDDKLAAVGYGDNYLAIWDIESKKIVYQLECHSGGVYSVKFVPKNKKIITSSLDSTIKIWDFNAQDKNYSMTLFKTLKGHTDYVLTLDVDPSGKWLLSGSKDLHAILTYIETGDMIYRIKAHTNTIITASFNTQGTTFCTGSGDQSVKIWSIAEADSVQ